MGTQNTRWAHRIQGGHTEHKVELTTMNAMLTSQDCICHCLFSPANEMSHNNTYGLTTMNAM